MTGSDDNFLARWSRRKRAAKAEEAPIPPSLETGQGDDAQHDGGGGSSSASGQASPPPPPPKSGVPDFGSVQGATREHPSCVAVPLSRSAAEDPSEAAGEPAEPLPRLEDLTPESDLSAFLRKGVPEALKLAALRRMWSLDPAIRDHVGPAEYAWDFNDPGAIAGFGPVGGDAAVGKALPSLSDITSQDSREPVASAPAASSAEGESSPQDPADSVGDIRRSAERHRDSSNAIAMADASRPESDPDAATPPRTAEEPGEARRSPSPPRHGGALPR